MSNWQPITQKQLDFMPKPDEFRYGTEPNLSFATGLLNMLGIENEQVYSQPFMFGEDASAMYGTSPDYPKYRDYEDYVNQTAPFPDPRNYIMTNEDGKMFIDQDRYDEDYMRHYQAKSPYPKDY